MDYYGLSKDILVPILSPLVAVIPILAYVRQERQKIFVQHEVDLVRAVRAAEREVILLRESYQLIGLKKRAREVIEPQRTEAFLESVERLFKTINESPSLYEAYFSKSKPCIEPGKLPLLLTELHIRLRQTGGTTPFDNFVLFALYVLLYARRDAGKDSEEKEILDTIHDADPALFGAWWDKAA